MGAIFSQDRKHRYLLWRELGGNGPIMSLGMVNPSDANEEKNDPTITRVDGFAKRLGVSKYYVWNLCAAVTSKVTKLRTMDDPIGPDNDAFILCALISSSIHVAAWGPLAKLPRSLQHRRLDAVRIADQLGVKFQCWDIAQDGQPRHPLMLRASLDLKPWVPC